MKVKEFVKGKKITKEEAVEIIKEHKNEEAIKKLNHIDRLKKLCKEAETICFVVETPGTTHSRQVHAAFLKEAGVKKTSSGNYVITGRDIEEELKRDIDNNIALSILRKRKDTEKCYRSYRIDRIVRGSINWS